MKRILLSCLLLSSCFSEEFNILDKQKENLKQIISIDGKKAYESESFQVKIIMVNKSGDKKNILLYQDPKRPILNCSFYLRRIGSDNDLNILNQPFSLKFDKEYTYDCPLSDKGKEKMINDLLNGLSKDIEFIYNEGE